VSTAQFADFRAGHVPGDRPAVARTSARTPVVLAAALLGLVLYAAFSHGAVGSPAEARLQVVLSAIAALAGGAWLWSGTLRFSAPRLAVAGIGLLGAFAVWSAITLLWSVAPDNTWVELNRTLTYVIVLVLALILGASTARAIGLISEGFLLVVMAVTLYGLGQKLIPGLHIGGLFDLNQTGALPRLQEPLGYWNALALLVALGAPVALMITVDTGRPVRARLAALVGLQLMLLAIGFTYSRGGVLAVAVGLVAAIALGGAWVRSLLWLGLAVVAALPPLMFGLLSHALTAARVGLGTREVAGGVLTAILIVSLLALVVGARRLVKREPTLRLGPERTRTVARVLLGGLGVLAVAAVLTVALSSRGIGGTVSHAWSSFTATRSSSNYDPGRLLSADSQNRWVWWKEAAGAFSDRPLGGWGAGSFPVTHLLYRRDTLSVAQPHSVPLQWLAETGAVGALLAMLGYGLLLAAGVSAVRRRQSGRERLLMASMLGAAVAYALHACYDWDWDIPAVTLPALLFLGVLAGSGGAFLRSGAPSVPRGPWMRFSRLGSLTLGLCVFALSAALPSLASSDVSSAILTAAGNSNGVLQSAQQQASLASDLDPLSDAGPRAQATIAFRRGDVHQAQADLLEAVRREPSDGAAWGDLAYSDVVLGDTTAALKAAERSLALDPLGTATGAFVGTVAGSANLLVRPPKDSATAMPLAEH
jgi:hypothetical protein